MGTSAIASPECVTTWLVVLIPLALWLLLDSILTCASVYTARLAIPLGVLLPPVIALFLLTRLLHLPQLLDAVSRS